MNAVHTYSVRTTCVMYVNWIFQRNKRVTLPVQRVCRDFYPMFIFLFSLYLIIKLNKFIFKYITVEYHHAFQHAAAVLYAINTRDDCLVECP